MQDWAKEHDIRDFISPLTHTSRVGKKKKWNIRSIDEINDRKNHLGFVG